MNSEPRIAFARRLGVNKGTVTKWAQSGRLVLTDRGDVVIDASLARLELTAGGRTDVAARHAAIRGAAIPTPQAGSDRGTAARIAPPVADIGAAETSGNRAHYKKLGLQYSNNTLKLEMALRRGLRLELSAVKREAHGLGATVRAACERLIDQTAPRLAVMDNELDRRRLIDAEIRKLRWIVRRELPAALRRIRAAGQERKTA